MEFEYIWEEKKYKMMRQMNIYQSGAKRRVFRSLDHRITVAIHWSSGEERMVVKISRADGDLSSDDTTTILDYFFPGRTDSYVTYEDGDPVFHIKEGKNDPLELWRKQLEEHHITQIGGSTNV